ncbi:uncharacterized protein L969DRAFT_44833 [Mixia osmundae IAM 14324]|uniref:Large ribosomal subunit protein uL5 C-terminal domain-containing protein n=1 Tax=Mixia osmundae (strain CBS 9802 / IAM 14324 / JCM 22182 / KY 12970) TaxID=764103 RepID=G7DTS4_MIXOS|nr:uncharacterized protein L969DRAFT_44833 [Mixia osmundae IAM 14324]KEI41700.1 hypothetical protein L969DRAFT_44833 [Mixia osmundae IAM 14324]GAA93984.1 hypothetical protein E5Q_00631 [Mixia osmundae IAM 14324]
MGPCLCRVSRRCMSSSSRAAATETLLNVPTAASSSLDSYSAIRAGPTQRSRWQEYYTNTLSSDLMYMTYEQRRSQPMPDPVRAQWDPLDPYTKNRPARRQKGGKPIAPKPEMATPSSVVKLEAIHLTTHLPEASGNKAALVPLLAVYQAITGQVLARPNSPKSASGIHVTKSRSGSASFKIRAGMPAGLRVTLKGPDMWTFHETLVEFVLPRLKDFAGIALPPATAQKNIPSALGGVVNLGLPRESMGLFPQIEINADAYPRQFGFQVSYATSAKGKGAQDRARALLSGLKIPFVRRSGQQ